MASEVTISFGTLKLVDSLATFTWSLELSLLRGKKPEESIWSPRFSTLFGDTEETKWQIQLYPNGINRKCRGFLSIYLHNLERDIIECKSLLVYFNVIDNQNQESPDVSVEELSVPSSRIRGIDKFIKRDLFTSGSSYFHNNSHLVVDGKVTLRCCICKMNEQQMSRPMPPPHSRKPDQSMQRSQSLGSLATLDDEDYNSDAPESLDDFDSLLVTGRSDVTLLASGKRFYAHKAVLATRSTVFAAQFEQDKLEKRPKSIVDTGDLDPEVLKKVMRFVYLGKISHLEDSAHELLGPANKYALNDLKDLCEDAMMKHLTIFNAIDYLKWSFAHEAARLRAHAVEFWADNRDAIMETPGFQSLAGSDKDLFVILITVPTTADAKEKSRPKCPPRPSLPYNQSDHIRSLHAELREHIKPPGKSS